MKHSEFVTFALTSEELLDRHLLQLFPDSKIRSIFKFDGVLLKYPDGLDLPDDLYLERDQYDNHIVTLSDKCMLKLFVALQGKNTYIIYDQVVSYGDNEVLGIPTITIIGMVTVEAENFEQARQEFIDSGFSDIILVDNDKFALDWSLWRPSIDFKTSSKPRHS